MRQSMKKVLVVSMIAALMLGNTAGLFAQQVTAVPASDASIAATIAALQSQLTKQQAQIEQLTNALAEQRVMIQQAAPATEPVRVVSLTPMIGSPARESHLSISRPAGLYVLGGIE